jgi:hypothetical protein
MEFTDYWLLPEAQKLFQPKVGKNSRDALQRRIKTLRDICHDGTELANDTLCEYLYLSKAYELAPVNMPSGRWYDYVRM